MLFPTPIFLFIFLPVVLALYYLPGGKRRRTARNGLLFAASLAFYAWGEPANVLLLLVSIVVNWLLGLRAAQRTGFLCGKAAVAAAVAFNLGLLFAFKYLGFAAANLELLLRVDVPVPRPALPIGISFFSFQALSYVIDVYRRKHPPRRNPLGVGLYVAFFPQLIAGPIVRYETIADEIDDRRENVADFSRGACRFMLGLAKKVVLANPLAVVADMAFGAESGLSAATAWLGVVAYAFQIYFDFSGYSDMAIGLGRMFGFHFLENFNDPYAATSITDFWRRWHISLSTWFRDYVYIPLGGSRVDSRARLVFNLFVVWTLTGLWHGANWTFVLWGALYFALLALEKLTGFAQRLGRWGHVYALFFVLLGWVLFRARDLAHAAAYVQTLFGLNGAPLADGTFVFYLLDYKIYLCAALLACLPVRHRLAAWPAWRSRIGGAAYVAGVALVFLIGLSFIVKSDYNPFIYFNF